MVRRLDLGPVRAGRGHCVIRDGGGGGGVEILQLALAEPLVPNQNFLQGLFVAY